MHTGLLYHAWGSERECQQPLADRMQSRRALFGLFPYSLRAMTGSQKNCDFYFNDLLNLSKEDVPNMDDSWGRVLKDFALNCFISVAPNRRAKHIGSASALGC